MDRGRVVPAPFGPTIFRGSFSLRPAILVRRRHDVQEHVQCQTTAPPRDREAPSLKAVLEDRVVVPTDYESLVSEYRVWWEHSLELTPPLGDRPWGTGVPGMGPTVRVRLGGGPQGAHFIS